MSAGLIQTGVVEIAGRYVFDLAGRNPAIFLPVIMVSVARAVGLHEQYRRHRLLRAAGDRLRRQDRRQPVAIPAAAGVRFDSDQLGHAHQHLDQPGGQRPLRPLPAAAHGHVRDGAGRHPDRHRRRALCLGHRRAPDPAARRPEGRREDRRAHVPGRRAGDGGRSAGRQVARGRQDHIGYRAGGGEAGARQGDHARASTRSSEATWQPATSCSSKACAPTSSRSRTSRDSTSRPTCIWPIRTRTRKEEKTIVEGVLLPRSPLIGQSLRSLDFKERYGLQVLAIHRAGRVPRTISSARLRMGDVLLLQGTLREREGAGAGQPVQHLRRRAERSGSIARARRWRRPSSRWPSSRRPSSSPRCRWRCWAAHS